VTEDTSETGRGRLEENKWCAGLVVKVPEAEPIHKRASERVLSLIFKISVTVEQSKRKVRMEIFQFKVMGLIRSAIANGCSMIRLETLGVGWKFGKVGIQGENQISRVLETWGENQIPDFSKRTIDLIPFQIKDPELKGQERSVPYLMYFFWKKDIQRASLWLERSFQPSLAIRETLMSFIRRMPKPPWSLGRQIEL
jgi:hypothetical protein